MTYSNTIRQNEFHYKTSTLAWWLLIYTMSNAFLSAYAVTVLSLLYVFYYLIASKYALPKDLMKYLAIPFVLIILGVAGSLGNMLYNVLKDGWYFINPPLVFCAGYLTMRRVNQIEPLLKWLVVCGFILALIHIVTILAKPSFLFEATVDQIRAENLGESFLTLISFIILLSVRKSDIVIFTSPHRRMFIPIIILADVASLFLSFSRTLWVSLVLFFLAQRGYFTFKRLKSLLIGLIILAGFFAFVLVAPDSMRSQSTMTGKILNSLDEMLVKDYYSKPDIATHWRGYETYRGFKAYAAGGIINYAIGQGFGALVDLGMEQKLGENTFTFIPIMHNGYMYILIKTGLIGLLLYIVYLLKFMKSGLHYSNYQDERLMLAGNFILAGTLVLFFTILVIAGMFNKSALVSVVFFLGALSSYVKTRSHKLDNGMS